MLNKVRFDSLITQHSTRYPNENRISKAGEQIYCFEHTYLLSVRKRHTCWGVWRPGLKPALHLTLMGCITLCKSLNTLIFFIYEGKSCTLFSKGLLVLEVFLAMSLTSIISKYVLIHIARKPLVKRQQHVKI